jgi:hypothetical protein
MTSPEDGSIELRAFSPVSPCQSAHVRTSVVYPTANPLRASIAGDHGGAPVDDDHGVVEKWGRSRKGVSCCSRITTGLVGSFVYADPFQNIPRGRPSGKETCENFCWTLVLIGLLVAYAVTQAISLRAQPPVFENETIPSLPVTEESLVMIMVIPQSMGTSSDGRQIRPVNRTYSCSISQDTKKLVAQAPLPIFHVQSSVLSMQRGNCSHWDFSSHPFPYGNPTESNDISSGVELPLTAFDTINVDGLLQLNAITRFAPNDGPNYEAAHPSDDFELYYRGIATTTVHDQDFDAVVESGDQTALVVKLWNTDNLMWSFRPNEKLVSDGTHGTRESVQSWHSAQNIYSALISFDPSAC